MEPPSSKPGCPRSELERGEAHISQSQTSYQREVMGQWRPCGSAIAFPGPVCQTDLPSGDRQGPVSPPPQGDRQVWRGCRHKQRGTFPYLSGKLQTVHKLESPSHSYSIHLDKSPCLTCREGRRKGGGRDNTKTNPYSVFGGKTWRSIQPMESSVIPVW